MIATMRIKRYSDSDLAGFVAVLTDNGYAVKLRKGNGSALMVEIADDSAKVRPGVEETEEWQE